MAGFPVQPNAPRIIFNGVTYAIGVFDWQDVMGDHYCAGIYHIDPAGAWAEDHRILNSNSALVEMQHQGGRVAFLAWFIAQVNAAFALMFPNVPVPPPEPANETDARAAIFTDINALKLTLVNGIPNLHS